MGFELLGGSCPALEASRARRIPWFVEEALLPHRLAPPPARRSSAGRALWRRTAVVVVCLLSLAGCKLRATTDIEVRDDGSGQVTVRLGLDQQARQILRTAGQEPARELEQYVRSELFVGRQIAVTPWKDGQYEGISASASFANLQDLRALLAGFTRRSGETLEITRVGDEFVFRASLKPMDISGITNTIPLPAQVTTGSLDVAMSVVLPGELVEHNADEVRGTRLTWKIDPAKGRDLSARSTVGSGIPLALLVGAGLVLLGLAVLVVIVVLVLRSRRRDPRRDRSPGAGWTPPRPGDEDDDDWPEPSGPSEPVAPATDTDPRPWEREFRSDLWEQPSQRDSPARPSRSTRDRATNPAQREPAGGSGSRNWRWPPSTDPGWSSGRDKEDRPGPGG